MLDRQHPSDLGRQAPAGPQISHAAAHESHITPLEAPTRLRAVCPTKIVTEGGESHAKRKPSFSADFDTICIERHNIACLRSGVALRPVNSLNRLKLVHIAKDV